MVGVGIVHQVDGEAVSAETVVHGSCTKALEAVRMAERLRRPEATRYLRERWAFDFGPTRLARLACIGGGPAYNRAGRAALYDVADLDAWARARLGPKASSGREHRSLAAEAAAGPA